jgi:hypothetical protein
MNDIAIDRLTLHVPGLSKAEGQRLALQIANGLGAAADAGGDRDVASLRLDLVAMPNAGSDELARMVIAELVRQVQRLP